MVCVPSLADGSACGVIAIDITSIADDSQMFDENLASGRRGRVRWLLLRFVLDHLRMDVLHFGRAMKGREDQFLRQWRSRWFG